METEKTKHLLIELPGLEFDEPTHTYTYLGQLLPGVTTITGVRQKEFLKWWTVKMAVEYLKEKQDEIKKATPEQFLDILGEAKRAHVRSADTAKDYGKEAHEWIEVYIKSRILDRDMTGEIPQADEVLNAINAFLGWERAHEVRWLASEVVIASVKHQFAGTLDALAEVDGKLSLVDFKTSNQIGDDYFLQTAGYQIALEELGVIPEQRIIVRIPKSGADCEAMVVPTPFEFDKETFLHCREVHRWNVYIKNHIADERGMIKVAKEKSSE